MDIHLNDNSSSISHGESTSSFNLTKCYSVQVVCVMYLNKNTEYYKPSNVKKQKNSTIFMDINSLADVALNSYGECLTYSNLSKYHRA
jgi:hypothetical protein